MTVNTTILRYGDESVRQVIKKSKIENGGGKDVRRIITIHGGAWRDATNTCADFDKFVEYWDQRGCNFVVYSIDYKLSKEAGGKYPEVLEDLMAAMDMVRRDADADADSDAGNMQFTLCGHSVGCTFMTQILEYNQNMERKVAKYTGGHLLPNITQAIFLDGIYDVRELLDEYPSYSFFIDEAFGDADTACNTCNFITRKGATDVTDAIDAYKTLQNVYVVHSTEDELLSLRQPDCFVTWLAAVLPAASPCVKIEKIYGDFGPHNNVYVAASIAALVQAVAEKNRTP